MLSYNGVIWKVTGTRDKLHGIWSEAAVDSATSLAEFIWALVLSVVPTHLLRCLVTLLYLAHEILEWWNVHIPVLWLQDPDFTGRHQWSAVWGFCSLQWCCKLGMQCWEVLPATGGAAKSHLEEPSHLLMSLPPYFHCTPAQPMLNSSDPDHKLGTNVKWLQVGGFVTCWKKLRLL